MFIRMEDSRTNPVRNDYTYPHFTAGVSIKGVAEQEWIDLLKSENPVDVLSALVFLGGKHMSPKERKIDVACEELDQAKLFERLKQSNVVNELIDKHHQSTIDWVREAAALVQKQKE